MKVEKGKTPHLRKNKVRQKQITVKCVTPLTLFEQSEHYQHADEHNCATLIWKVQNLTKYCHTRMLRKEQNVNRGTVNEIEQNRFCKMD
jgi:hypothetical protein